MSSNECTLVCRKCGNEISWEKGTKYQNCSFCKGNDWIVVNMDIFAFKVNLQKDKDKIIMKVANMNETEYASMKQRWELKKIGTSSYVKKSNDELNKANESETNKVICPYCHSDDTDRLTILDRSVSIMGWGIASGKIGKQWHCNKCKSNF